jgi:branched-chain amino acid transport system ATP-binding protein
MTEPILRVRHLRKAYGALLATNDLSFDVARGEVHALIGPNGAGKTTLVNQLSGLLRPDSGSILLDGEEISRMQPWRRTARGLARSFQITSIFDHLSVAENLALAILAQNGHNFRFWQRALDGPLVRRNLPSMLARIDLAEQAERPARTLSHGQKKQLEVGMALAGNPRLLIFDEPMAGLGPGGTVEMSRLLRALKGSMTILLVEHDMEAVFSLADRITVLVYGRNLATGTPTEIRANAAVRTAYLGEG